MGISTECSAAGRSRYVCRSVFLFFNVCVCVGGDVRLGVFPKGKKSSWWFTPLKYGPPIPPHDSLFLW